MATKATVATVRKSLPNASPEKLVAHYNTLQEAYRSTDDVRSQGEIIALQQEILAELDRRGIATGR